MTTRSPNGKRAFAFPGFRWLWSGQLVGLLGDQLFPIAMVAVLSHRDETPMSLGVVFGARFLGLSLLIVAAGVVADRLSRVQLLMVSDAIRAAAILGLLAMGLDAPLWVLAVMTFIMGAGEAIFEPAYDSFIPELVADPALASANASSNVLRGTGQFAGPALGAVVVTEFGVNAALTIDAATFVVSTLAVLIAGRHRLEVLAESRGDKPVSMVREALDGLRVVIDLKWPGVLELMALVHVLLAVGPWMVLLPFVAAEGGGNLYGYGATLSAFAVGGGLAGAPLAGAIVDRLRRPGTWAVVAIGLFSLACFALAGGMPWYFVLGMSFVAGAGTQFFDVVTRTAIQRQVPRSHLGRVFAIDFFASFAAMPAGQLLAGFVVSSPEQARFAMAISGFVVVVISSLVLLSPAVRRLSRDLTAGS
ncbi:MFS transporter [Dermatophilus congolensis]|uniref:MFS transporter n=1 Tax=Dermatophilus congolensis TaxID=1863 RepID=UPI001AB03513|nr:MFS transporter [Dermatophilus congolensis]MBO3136916.1 MFS transporter [Dermatophilus congolensis]